MKYLANAIVSGKQFILVAHLYPKSGSIAGCTALLSMAMQWKTVVYLPKELTMVSLSVIECGVNMIVLED